MPETTTKKAKRQGKDGVYWIVNPAGAIHSVTREHAKMRLATAGWRMATEKEIAAFLTSKRGITVKREDGKTDFHRMQVFDEPLCTPWTPDPDAQIELE